MPSVILLTPQLQLFFLLALCCFCPVPSVILSTRLSYSSSSCWLCVVFVLCPELSSLYLSVTALLLAGFVLLLSCAERYPLYTSQLQLFLLALCCFCPVPSVILSTRLSYSSSSCWLCVVFVLYPELSSLHLSVTALLAGFVLFLSCAERYPIDTSQLQFFFLLALCCFCPVPRVILSIPLSYSSSSCWLCVVFVLCRALSSLHLSVTALLAGFVLFLSRAERYPIDTSQLQLFFLLALCCFCPVPRVILSTPLSYSSSSCWLCCFCPVPRVILSTPLSYSSSSCWLCVVFVLCPELSSRHLSYSSSCWLCVVFVPCRALSSRHLSVTALLAGFVLFLSCAQSYPLDTSQLQLFFLLALCCFCPVPSVILSTPLSYSSSSCWLCVVFVLCRALSSRHLSVTALLAGFVFFLSCAQSYPLDTSQLQLFFLLALCCFCPVPSVILFTPLSYSSSCWLCVVFVLCPELSSLHLSVTALLLAGCVVFVPCRALSSRHLSVTALILAGFVLFLSCAQSYPLYTSVTALLAGFMLFLFCVQRYPLYTSQLQLFFLLALCCFCPVPSVILSTPLLQLFLLALCSFCPVPRVILSIPLSYSSSSCWLCVVFVLCRALSSRHLSVTALLLAGFVLFLSCAERYPLDTSQLQLFLLALCSFCPVPRVILSIPLSYSSSSCWLCVVFVPCRALSSRHLSVTALLAGFVLFLSCAQSYPLDTSQLQLFFLLALCCFCPVPSVILSTPLSYSSSSCWLCVVFVLCRALSSRHLSVTALLAGFVFFLSCAQSYPLDTSQLQLFFLLALCCFCPVPSVILSTPLSYSSSSCWLCVVFVLCRALSSLHLSVTALLAGFVFFLSCAQSYPLDTSQLQLFFLLALCCFCPVPSVILSTPLSYSSSSCWLCVVFVLCRALSSRHLSVTALLAGFVLFLSCAQSYVALLTNVQQTHCTLRQWIFPFVKHVGAHYGRAVPTWVSECHIPVIPSLFPHQICYNCGSV